MTEQKENSMIDVVIKYPNQKEVVTKIKNEYKEISKICCGMIDIISFPYDDEISIICNDEFIHLNMEANIVIPEFNTILAGPIIFTGFDFLTGDTISLNDKQTKSILDYLKKHSVMNMRLDEAYSYMQSNFK